MGWKACSYWFSPRTWGWTVDGGALEQGEAVFPTHVGMDRGPGTAQGVPGGFPHARGDGPSTSFSQVTSTTFSPRTWGWTDAGILATRRRYVFPTHVGMDRLPLGYDSGGGSFPHARGDGPPAVWTSQAQVAFSPRTWGWTVPGVHCWVPRVVFPTHVGMDRPPVVPCIA